MKSSATPVRRPGTVAREGGRAAGTRAARQPTEPVLNLRSAPRKRIPGRGWLQWQRPSCAGPKRGGFGPAVPLVLRRTQRDVTPPVRAAPRRAPFSRDETVENGRRRLFPGVEQHIPHGPSGVHVMFSATGNPATVWAHTQGHHVGSARRRSDGHFGFER